VTDYDEKGPATPSKDTLLALGPPSTSGKVKDMTQEDVNTILPTGQEADLTKVEPTAQVRRSRRRRACVFTRLREGPA